MPNVEDRLKAIEQALGLGFGGRNKSAEDVRVALGRLRDDQVSGNVYGGMIRTSIGPGFTYIGPFIRDVDSSFSLEFELPIPDYMLRISRCNLHVVLRPVRSSVAVASSSTGTPSGGGDTSGSSSAASSGIPQFSGQFTTGITPLPFPDTGGPSTANTGSGGTGNTGSGGTGNTGSGGTANTGSTDPGDSDSDGATTTSFEDGHAHSVGNHTHGHGSHTHSGPSHTHSGPSHTHSGPSHTHSLSSHTHEMGDHIHGVGGGADEAHTHGIAHTHSTPDHTHPNHSHTLTLAIAEGGSPAGVNILIDGSDRTSELGGPWDDDFDIDIRTYLITVIDQRPVVGVHTIEITSTSVGALEVTGDLYGVLRPPTR